MTPLAAFARATGLALLLDRGRRSRGPSAVVALVVAALLAGCAGPADEGMTMIDPPALVLDDGGSGGSVSVTPATDPSADREESGGVFAPPGGTPAPHGLFLLSALAPPFRFLDLEGEGPLIGLGGDERAVVFDLSTREVLYEREAEGHSFWGVAGWDAGEPGAGPGEIFAFGSAGAGGRAVDPSGGLPSFEAEENHLDVLPFGGAVGASGAVVVHRDTLTLTSASGGAARVAIERGFGVAPWVSAYATSADAPFLAITSYPGELYLVDPTVATEMSMEKIADLGEDLRRLRCALPICVASDWGGGALRVVVWDGAGEPTLGGSVRDVQGPVGIDIRRAGDAFEVVSTGYEDDSIHVTRIAQDGSVVSSERRDAPPGCNGPGHALFVGDDILVSCTDSGKLALVPT